MCLVLYFIVLTCFRVGQFVPYELCGITGSHRVVIMVAMCKHFHCVSFWMSCVEVVGSGYSRHSAGTVQTHAHVGGLSAWPATRTSPSGYKTFAICYDFIQLAARGPHPPPELLPTDSRNSVINKW